MHQALELAKMRKGFCAPNPSVGAVVVKDNRILSTGHHFRCGEAHGEAAALNLLGERAQGASLYVTLEPCSHYGRTPPCTELIIRSGVREVIYAEKDPNPRVSGNGAAVLQRAGVSCRQQADPSVTDFYRSYSYWLTHGRPYVTAKLAVTMDGKIAGPHGKPLQITGRQCQEFTHQQRLRSDAILSTATTVIADDPQLNVRLNQETVAKPLYLLDTHLRVSPRAKIFQTVQSITLFHDQSASQTAVASLVAAGAKCISVGVDSSGLNLAEVLTVIGKEGCHDLWVEAGGRLFNSLVQQRLVQQIFIYIAPQIAGLQAMPAFPESIQLLTQFTKIHWQVFGDDVIAKIEN